MVRSSNEPQYVVHCVIHIVQRECVAMTRFKATALQSPYILYDDNPTTGEWGVHDF